MIGSYEQQLDSLKTQLLSTIKKQEMEIVSSKRELETLKVEIKDEIARIDGAYSRIAKLDDKTESTNKFLIKLSNKVDDIHKSLDSLIVKNQQEHYIMETHIKFLTERMDKVEHEVYKVLNPRVKEISNAFK